MSDEWGASEDAGWDDKPSSSKDNNDNDEWGANDDNNAADFDDNNNSSNNNSKNAKGNDENISPLVQIENAFYEAQDLVKEDAVQAKTLFDKCVSMLLGNDGDDSKASLVTSQTVPWLLESLERLTLLCFTQNQTNEMTANFEKLIKQAIKAEKKLSLETHSSRIFDGLFSSDDNIDKRCKAAQTLLSIILNIDGDNKDKSLFSMWFYGAKKLMWVYVERRETAAAKKLFEAARKNAVDALNPDLNLSLTNPADVNHFLRDLELCAIEIELLKEEKEEKAAEQVCYRAEKLLESAKQGRFVNTISGRVLGTVGFNLGHFRSQAKQWNAAKEAYAFGCSGYAEFGAEKEAVESLKRMALCDLLNGALVSPFHNQQYRAYAEKKELKLISDMRRAHEEGDMDQYGKLLKDPVAQAGFKNDVFISKVITIEALAAIKAPKLPDDMRIYYKKVDPEKAKDSNCSICMDSFNAENGAAFSLPSCTGHYFHKPCINDWISRTKKCPICGKFYGKVVGAMPPGKMNISKSSGSLSGHPGCGHYVLSFDFPGGVQTEEQPHPGVRYGGDSRVAYLPDSEEGRQVLELFKRGWDQKLLFRIGYSETRCVDDVIVYNGIHMKSSTSGPHGFPDPTYLTRVKEEFATKGIVPE